MADTDTDGSATLGVEKVVLAVSETRLQADSCVQPPMFNIPKDPICVAGRAG